MPTLRRVPNVRTMLLFGILCPLSHVVVDVKIVLAYSLYPNNPIEIIIADAEGGFRIST